MGGFAQGTKVTSALESVGIVAAGWFWRWYPGIKGGVFPPHLDLGGEFSTDIEEFGSIPQGDVNGDSCECQFQTVWRDERTGRFAKPIAASAHTHSLSTDLKVIERPRTTQFDVERFLESFLGRTMETRTPTPVNVTVNVPEQAVIVNVPETPPPIIRIEPTPIYMSPIIQPSPPTPVTVNVEPPNVTVESTTVNVDSPTVNVSAPEVTVQPKIDVRPAPVKIIREKVAGRKVRFRRNNDGTIESAEVTE